MNTPGNNRWVVVAVLVGIVYLAAGIGFAALAKTAASDQLRTAWRLAAWLTSGAAFALHIVYEQSRLRSSAVTTALHVTLGVILGSFALAAAAIVHAQSGGLVNQRLLSLALVLWPAMTAVPAFVVALVAAALLGRLRRRRQPTEPV